MGWTYTRRDKGVSTKDFFAEQFTPLEILDSAVVGTVVYMAARNPGTEKVFGLVILTHRNPKDSYYNFGYKDMTESMGPCYWDCPERILNLLSPTDYEYSVKWRETCRKRAAERRKLRSLVPGVTVEFTEPIRFKGGASYRKFTRVDPRKWWFRVPDGSWVALSKRFFLDYSWTTV